MYLSAACAVLRAKTFVLLGRRVGIAAVFIAIAVINNGEDCCSMEARRHQLCRPTQNLFNLMKKREGETAFRAFRAGPIFSLSCVCVYYTCTNVQACVSV